MKKDEGNTKDEFIKIVDGLVSCIFKSSMINT